MIEKDVEAKMSVVLLTGNERRHRFVASRLVGTVNLVGIVSEVKSSPVAAPELLPRADQDVITRHFARQDEAERRLMGASGSFPDTELLKVPATAVNAPAVFDWLQRLDPHVVVLYGTSIIKPPLLDTYAGRMINIHLGLSPYYRGSATNFWPLVNRQPECVGATIHLVVAEVDAGSILAQVRPSAEISDRSHELGTKTIIAAADALPHVISRYMEGRIVPQTQDLARGRIFRRKDFKAESVRVMWRNFETGMMSEYLAEAEYRRRQYPIVHLSNHVA